MTQAQTTHRGFERLFGRPEGLLFKRLVPIPVQEVALDTAARSLTLK